MNDDLQMTVDTIESLRAHYDAGIVVLYSLTTAHECIVLRAVTTKQRDPERGRAYIVEFRDAKTSELLEVLEEEKDRLFDSSTIMSVMDVRTPALAVHRYVPDLAHRGRGCLR